MSCSLFNKSRILSKTINVILGRNTNTLFTLSKNKVPINTIIPSASLLNNNNNQFINQINQLRYKSKDRGKSKKGKTKVEVNLSELAEVIDVTHYEDQMQKCINHLKEEYVKNLSLRSTTGN